jgi:hypothetical protein
MLMMMGIDVRDYPLQNYSGPNNLRECLQNNRVHKVLIPEILLIFATLWNESRMRKRLQCVSNANRQFYRPKQASRSNLSPLTNSMGSFLKKELSCETSTKSLDQEKGNIAINSHFIMKNGLSDHQMDDDEILSYEEDKTRKVLRLLDQGDMVVDVYNISQIFGPDACECLLLLCKNNIYLVEIFFQRSDGEVVEIWNAPNEEQDKYLLLVERAAGVEIEQSGSMRGGHTCKK